MRVLVTGAGGQLGCELARALVAHDAVLLDRAALDVARRASVHEAIGSTAPDAIIHAAAWTDVDACEGDRPRALRIHVDGTRNVVEAAGAAFVVVVSTDYVFDGSLGRAYLEIDAPNPLQVYGFSKLQAERVAREASEHVAIVRSAWLYGARTASGEPARNFVHTMLGAGSKGPVEVVSDQVGSPTSVADLSRALVGMVERQVPGVFHVVNSGAASRADFARAILQGAGMDPDLIRPVTTSEAAPRVAVRPLFAPLEGRAWVKAGFDALPRWEDALARALPDILAAR